MTTPSVTVRDYQPADEPSWLRCRALSFLGSAYFDDVKPRRTRENQIELVAVLRAASAGADDVVGILDVEIDGNLATIDTLAVHPDHQGLGIASALLEEALRCLPQAVATLDAWTRDDEPALAWYRSRGFEESDHYLHVYKTSDTPDEGWSAPEGLSAPVLAFAHGSIEDEAAMRERFERVHVCRRFARSI